MLLTTMPADGLSCIVACVPSEDWLCVALVCMTLCAVCTEHAKSNREDEEPLWITAVTSTLPRVKWALNIGATMTSKWCTSAARDGNLTVLRWLHKRGCPWDKEACVNACHKGRLEVLKWLHAHGCPCCADCYAAAANNGHLDVIKWLRTYAPECPWDTFAGCEAAINDHYEVFRWLHNANCPVLTMNAFHHAAGSSLRIVKYMIYHGCLWDINAFINAASAGCLDVLMYLHHMCFDFHRDGGAPASLGYGTQINGKWTAEFTSPLHYPFVCDAAAENGHIAVLEWLHENGYAWDNRTCERTIKNKNLATLKYLRKYGCPWNPTFCFDIAVIMHGDQDPMVKWIAQNKSSE